MTQSQDFPLQNQNINLLCLLCSILYLFPKEQNSFWFPTLLVFTASSGYRGHDENTVLGKEVSRKFFPSVGSWFCVPVPISVKVGVWRRNGISNILSLPFATLADAESWKSKSRCMAQNCSKERWEWSSGKGEAWPLSESPFQSLALELFLQF